MTNQLQRRTAFRLLAAALISAGSISASLASDNGSQGDSDGSNWRQGKIFTRTNAAAGNEVLIFSQAQNGPAVLAARVATHGLGSGAGLGSQGAVTLSGNGRHLFVVNASSNTPLSRSVPRAWRSPWWSMRAV